MQRLKERLVARRNNLNFSQKALAERSGVSERSIAAYETGTSQPTHRQLEKLATALSVEPSWLLGAEEPQAMVLRDSPRMDTSRSIPMGLIPTGLLDALFNALLRRAEARESDRLVISHLLVAISQEMQSRPPEPEAVSSASAFEPEKSAAVIGGHALKNAPAHAVDIGERARRNEAGERTSRKDQRPSASGHPSKLPRPAREEEGKK